MDQRRKIFDVPETEEPNEDSAYLVAMGDGTGTKHIKHKNLIARIKEGIAAWVDAKIPVLVNNLLGTEPGQALDARQGPEIDRRLNEISGNLSNIHPAPTGEAQQVTLINNTYTADMDCYLQVNFSNGANSRMSCWVQTDCLWISQTTYTWETIHLAVPLNAGKTAKISQDGDNTNGYTVVKIPM